mmetsp:Transcript_20893/g.24035  ORF Transcript_20893/g.24035 Transcript_20893/m.24035 type:complete len:106 (+) Transcript_20893:140-457(+)|eukprot:CAMPEP_0171294136 /NCGR_PEP_ID=MMETSP0816-20121228/2532_1 /TAXON_ID=420281 /ORGANISM="Proboscia inermis, Strain CCAP1064/1" /LENGTH=105 /DNA_ID=CAMNT_0011765661 /DNA_START=6 /DNA_END=323 /DNA_ORIENTATION=+
MVDYVKSLEEYDALLELSKTQLIVLHFTAAWCGPCQKIAPILQNMVDVEPDVKFCKVDVDENKSIANKCEVNALALIHFYKNGIKVAELKGANAEQIQEQVTLHK